MDTIESSRNMIEQTLPFLKKLRHNDSKYQYCVCERDMIIPLIFSPMIVSKKQKWLTSEFEIPRNAGKCLVMFGHSSDSKIILCQLKQVEPAYRRSKKSLLKEKSIHQVDLESDVRSFIIDLWKTEATEAIKSISAICKAIIDPNAARSYNINKFTNCQQTEADTNIIIESAVKHKLFYWQTPAATCRSDAGFRLDNFLDDAQNVGIQLKVANMQLSGIYSFNRCNSYPGMIIVCHPKSDNQEKFLIIPNNQILPSFQYTGQQKYAKYLVAMPDVADLLAMMYIAVRDKQTTLEYPNGAEIDISDLRFFTEDELNTPTSVKCKKEYENTKRREKLFPSFTYDYPHIQSTYDVLIDSVQIQDKCAEGAIFNPNTFRAKIVKNAGNKDGKRRKAPYEAGDFDALFVNLPDDSGIFLIPAKEMVARGILKTNIKAGKQWISCFKPGYVPCKNMKIDTWTENYFVAFDDVERETKVRDILKESSFQKFACL